MVKRKTKASAKSSAEPVRKTAKKVKKLVTKAVKATSKATRQVYGPPRNVTSAGNLLKRIAARQAKKTVTAPKPKASPTPQKKIKKSLAWGGKSAKEAVSSHWTGGKTKSPLLSKNLKGGHANPIRSALAQRLKAVRSEMREGKPKLASGLYDRRNKSIAKSRGTNILKNTGAGKLTPSFTQVKSPVKGGLTFKGKHYAPGTIAPGTKYSRVKVSMKDGKAVGRYLERGLTK